MSTKTSARVEATIPNPIAAVLPLIAPFAYLGDTYLKSLTASTDRALVPATEQLNNDMRLLMAKTTEIFVTRTEILSLWMSIWAHSTSAFFPPHTAQTE